MRLRPFRTIPVPTLHYQCTGCRAWLPEGNFYRVGNAETVCDRRGRCIACGKMALARKVAARADHRRLSPPGPKRQRKTA